MLNCHGVQCSQRMRWIGNGWLSRPEPPGSMPELFGKNICSQHLENHRWKLKIERKYIHIHIYIYTVKCSITCMKVCEMICLNRCSYKDPIPSCNTPTKPQYQTSWNRLYGSFGIILSHHIPNPPPISSFRPSTHHKICSHSPPKKKTHPQLQKKGKDDSNFWTHILDPCLDVNKSVFLPLINFPILKKKKSTLVRYLLFHATRTPRSIYASYLMYEPIGTGEMTVFQITSFMQTQFTMFFKNKNDQHLLQLNHQIFRVTP